MNKSRRIWGHLARMGEMRNTTQFNPKDWREEDV
jgi:hypothetical protein